MKNVDDMVFAACKARVVAFEASSGSEVWQTKVKGGAFSGGIPTLCVDPYQVIVALNGRLTALDRQTGEVIWSTKVRSFGSGTIIMASDWSATSNTASIAAAQAAAAQAAAAGAAGGAAAAAGAAASG